MEVVAVIAEKFVEHFPKAMLCIAIAEPSKALLKDTRKLHPLPLYVSC